MLSLLFLSAAICAATASPYPSRQALRSAAPTVHLDAATVTGVTVNSTIEQFLGIPFAQPPTGKLRYSAPVAVNPYNASFSATEYGPYCLQIPVIEPGVTPANFTPESEDCLTINVMRPAGYDNVTLPVLAWIFGGAFASNGAAGYDGSVIVQKSIDIGSPVVYVGFNHRLNGFGFLASQEITDAGVANLGLQDQREALRWIQKYIHSFGGDPAKVTLFGTSSGGKSTALHMLLNGGNNEGLFRAAFCESGAPLPVGSYKHGQKWYDGAVQATNCTAANDTLECLREADVETLQAYFATTPSELSYEGLAGAWFPRVDGKYLKADPQQLVLEGSVANIPFISGNNDDEGTLFSLYTTNITTDALFAEWVQSVYYPNATAAEIDLVLKLYPSNPSVGSPFNTGTNDVLYPQYKRISAFQGDAGFQGPRRFFLQQRASRQKTWSYLDKRGKTFSPLGAQHGVDIVDMYGTGNGTELQDYVINFAYNLDPNGPTVPAWPQYTLASPNLLTLQAAGINITEDTFRVAPIEGVTAIGLKYPL